MQHHGSLVALGAVLLAGSLSAQAPRVTQELQFDKDVKIALSYQQIDFGSGAWADALLADNDQGARVRQFFNESDQGFKGRVDGRLTLAALGMFGDLELDPGTYKLTFRVDDDLIWHAVVLTEDDEEIGGVVLDVAEAAGDPTSRLVLQPLAADNAKTTGALGIRFGKMVASLPFRCGEEGAEGGGNSNDNSPRASHRLELASGVKMGVSYCQLTVGGGRNFRSLIRKGDAGDRMRQFYNSRYLPQYLDGALELSVPMTLGGETLPAGSYGFTFRVDNELTWHLVVTGDDKEVAVVPLATSTADSKADNTSRLVVMPIATSDTGLAGQLEIRFGPLQARLPFAPVTGDSSLPGGVGK